MMMAEYQTFNEPRRKYFGIHISERAFEAIRHVFARLASKYIYGRQSYAY